ncbi:MauE/DoxX family redox-associated membrane protein [Olivibacter sitiensis]|uniref:MauE/DoxX family redox-associated membrane protein n=1 Tax=Olivibacter sitiensis TaxID=376470 RepID=UPI000415EF13|nr:MauE/DoxX family redox-associated membrane protein [Olivibacter sitiensis]
MKGIWRKVKTYVGTHWRQLVINACSFLLMLLWIYASASKLGNYDQSQWEMRNQVFPDPLADQLVWIVPSMEILLAIGLMAPQTRILALWASGGLLLAFTLYIAITATKVFGRVPCSCGGIISNMPYWLHACFNIAYLGIVYLALYLHYGSVYINGWFHKSKGKEAIVV